MQSSQPGSLQSDEKKDGKLTEESGIALKKRLEKKIDELKEKKELKTTQDLHSLIVSLQTRRKLRISRKKTLQATAKDLGEDNKIDIHKQSTKNLIEIRKRLLKGKYLPLDEKKPSTKTSLTYREEILFKILINKKYIIHHTTSTKTLELTRTQAQGNSLLDPVEAKRRHITERTATPDFCGIENNIFFGFGTNKKKSLPLFARKRQDPQTKKIEDYSTIEINYSAIQEQNPDLLFGHWSSGHFAHYEHAASGYKSDPIEIGDTQFYCEYDLQYRFIHHKKKYIKNLVFIRKDGHPPIKIPLGIGDEIATGKDFILFFAYSFIERLRCIGGKVRESILSQLNDEMLDILIEKLFRVDEFEMHLPTKFPLDNPYTEIITPQRRKEITETVSKAAAAGKISELNKLREQGYPFDGYMYEDPYQYDSSPATDLPIVAAIKSRKMATVRWLIENGANRSVFSLLATNKTNNLLRETNDAYISTVINILKAVYETGDPELMDYLIRCGLDLNASWQKINILLNLPPATALLVWSDDAKTGHSDLAFLSLVSQTSKNGDFKFFDFIANKLGSLKDKKSVENNLALNDIARAGDEKIFNHFIKNYPHQYAKIYYDKLLEIAIKNNNRKIIPFLMKQFIAPDKKTGGSKKIQKELIDLGWLAFDEGHFELIEELIPKKNIKSSFHELKYQESLFFTTKDDNDNPLITKKIQWLLDKEIIQADHTCTGSSLTLIEYLTSHGQYEAARLLIRKKITADPLLDKAFDKPAFINAIRSKNIDEIKLLLKHPKIDLADSTIMYAAFEAANHEIIKLLIDNGASVPTFSHEEVKEYTGLVLQNNELNILNYLIHNIPSKIVLRDALIYWLANRTFISQEIVMSVVKWMKEHGMEIDGPDSAGNTLLKIILENAAVYQHTLSSHSMTLLKMISENRTEIPEVKLHGPGALINSLLSGNVPDGFIEWLIRYGVGLNVIIEPNKNSMFGVRPAVSPLEAACQAGNVSLVKGLLEAGASPDIYGQRAPLSIVCGQFDKENAFNNFEPTMALSPSNIQLKKEEMIKALISYGATVTPSLLKWLQKNTPELLILLTSPTELKPPDKFLDTLSSSPKTSLAYSDTKHTDQSDLSTIQPIDCKEKEDKKKITSLIKYHDFSPQGLNIYGKWYSNETKKISMIETRDSVVYSPDESLIKNIINKYLETFPDKPPVKMLTQTWTTEITSNEVRADHKIFNSIIMDEVRRAQKQINSENLILVSFFYQSHNSGLAIDIKNKRAIYIDPFSLSSQHTKHIRKLKALLVDAGFEFQIADMRQQSRNNMSSCGPILMASFMKFIDEYLATGLISTHGFSMPLRKFATEQMLQIKINNDAVLLKDDDDKLHINEIMLADISLWKAFFDEYKLSSSMASAILQGIALQKKFIGGLKEDWQSDLACVERIDFIENFQSKVTKYIQEKKWADIRYLIVMNSGYFDVSKPLTTHAIETSQLIGIIDDYIGSLSCCNFYGRKRAQELQNIIEGTTIESLPDQLNAFIKTGRTQSDSHWYNFFRSPTLNSGTSRSSLRGMLIDYLNPELKTQPDKLRKTQVYQLLSRIR